MSKPNEPAGTQLDIEQNQTDRAIRAVKDYQAGKCTTAFLRSSLAALPSGSFLYVSLATRVPVAQLEKLAGGSPA